MSPASDLDLVFIREGSQREVAEEVVKKILYILWDLGCKVGHACRTIEETIERSESEPMIKTSLLDARYLAGSKLLWEKVLCGVQTAEFGESCGEVSCVAVGKSGIETHQGRRNSFCPRAQPKIRSWRLKGLS